MCVEHPLNVMAVVHVGVEMDQVQRGELAQAPDRRESDCVVAAHDHGQCAPGSDFLDGLAEFVKVAGYVRGDYGDIAAVGHGHALQQLAPGIDVKEPFGLGLCSQGVGVGICPGGVPDGVGPEPGPRPAEGALIKGHADEGDPGIQLFQILA